MKAIDWSEDWKTRLIERLSVLRWQLRCVTGFYALTGKTSPFGLKRFARKLRARFNIGGKPVRRLFVYPVWINRYAGYDEITKTSNDLPPTYTYDFDEPVFVSPVANKLFATPQAAIYAAAKEVNGRFFLAQTNEAGELQRSGWYDSTPGAKTKDQGHLNYMLAMYSKKAGDKHMTAIKRSG